MFLSIIIPVYKAEKFIKNTLSSIYNQNFPQEKFEVIIINDGTPDHSLDIVSKYREKYANIIVINQENGGPGPGLARNAGIQVAKGDYIWFVDSDDTICEGSLPLVEESINKHPMLDIYGFDIWKVYEKEGGRKEYSKTINKTGLRHLYNEVVTDQLRAFLRGTIWCFIFKRSFLVDNELLFYPHILHEDMEFMTRCYFMSSSMLIVDRPIYNYLIRSNGSIMSSIKLNYYDDKLRVLSSLEKEKAKRPEDKKGHEYMNTSIFRIALSIVLPNDYSRSHQEQTENFVKSHLSNLRRFGRIGIIPLIKQKDYKTTVFACMMATFPYLLFAILKMRDR